MRVSYSIAAAWHRGDYDTAIEMWKGGATFRNQAMQDGVDYHKYWENESKVTGNLPAIFGSQFDQISKPPYAHPLETEVKIEKKLAPWLTIVGVIDARRGQRAVDYKTGSTKAGAYVSGHQHLWYKVLDPALTIFDYYAYNQHTGTITFERVHLNDESLRQGMVFVMKNALEMKLTLSRMGYDTSSHKSRRKT